MKSAIEEVFSAIDGERDYQDNKWGKPHLHDIAEFVLFMRGYHNKVVMMASTESGWNGALDELRKVAALGVACLEQHAEHPDNPDLRKNLYDLIKTHLDAGMLRSLVFDMNIGAMIILAGHNIASAEKAVAVTDSVLARDALTPVRSCVAVCVACMMKYGVVRR